MLLGNTLIVGDPDGIGVRGSTEGFSELGAELGIDDG